MSRAVAALLVAAFVAAAVAGCDGPDPDPGHDRFTIETDKLRIHVEGSIPAMERNAGQIMTRLDLIDPALIRPGVGLWVDDSPSTPEPPGEPSYELVGRVVSVERIDPPTTTEIQL